MNLDGGNTLNDDDGHLLSMIDVCVRPPFFGKKFPLGWPSTVLKNKESPYYFFFLLNWVRIYNHQFKSHVSHSTFSGG